MSYEALIEYIKKEGEARRNEILKRAEKQGEEILSRAYREFEAKKETIHRSLERGIQEEKVKRLNRAFLKKQEIISRAMAEVLDELFQAISESLEDIIRKSSYRSILRSLLMESLQEVEGKVMVKASRKDLKIIKEIAREEGLNNSVIEGFTGDDTIKGGIEVISTDGDVSIMNTLWSRLEKIKDEVMPEIRKILFPDIP